MSDNANETPFFYVDPRIEGHFTIQPPLPMALHVTWGEATITFHGDGRLVLEGLPTPDAAAQAFWRAVHRWAPAGIQVILPPDYGKED